MADGDSTPAKSDEERFTVAELRERARLEFGCSSHAVVGALARRSKKTFTVSEAKQLVGKFLSKPVS